jgi:SHS2 domain-containing protein
MVKARYEFREHTADIIIRAFGASLEEAFAAAAGALFDVITDRADISPDEAVTVTVESIDREGLLVALLSELIVRFEVDGWVLSDFEVAFTSATSLRVTGRGERFDREKHGHGIQVKGASYHLMEINDSADDCYVQVLLDI